MQTFIKTFLLCASFAILSATMFPAPEGKKLKIAVLDIQSRVNDEKIDTVTLSELLQSALVDRKAFTVVDRDNLSKIIAEQKFQVSGMTENEMTKIGSMAGADKIVVGSLSKITGKYVLVIKMIDTSSGSIDFSSQLMDTVLENIIGSLPRLAESLDLKVRDSSGPVTTNTAVNSTTNRQVDGSGGQTQSGTPGESNKFFAVQLSLWPPVQIIPEDFRIYGLAVTLPYGCDAWVIGLQCGLANQVTDTLEGLQTGVVNISGKDAFGVQIGVINISKNLWGVQFGVVNIADRLSGLQIGLLNFAKNGWVGFLPIVNVRF